MSGFLPVTREEMRALGVEQPDFVYISGDAYVDHPSFGHAVISRVLEDAGYSVGMICQPDWLDPESIKVFGRPRLGFLVTAGNMDSMVNHYSVAKRPRGGDSYSPGGVGGMRPDRATAVYTRLVREVYGDIPVVIGGIEASLRRFSHYDYWSDSVRESMLMESGADILLYGMGEKSVVEVANALRDGTPVRDITWVRGSAYRTSEVDSIPDALALMSYEDTVSDKRKYAKSFMRQYQNTDPYSGKVLTERYIKRGEYVVQNPPCFPLTREELDRVYELPYMRTWHPMYTEAGGIPAIAEVKFSLVSCRGCFGSCSFCALAFHQGRIVSSRSEESLIKEAKLLTEDPDFKGYIHDVGGPTANFRYPACKKQNVAGACKDKQCLWPEPCKAIEADHSEYLHLLRELRSLPKVKKVFVRSGIRFDYLMADPDREFFRELVRHHVSGQLKVAPEHVSEKVLSYMGKPKHKVFEAFAKEYRRLCREEGKDQYLVPYFISSHPGCGLDEAIELALYLKKSGLRPEQVQDFYPTPSTLATCMFYTGLDPRDMSPVFVAKDPHDKALQRALMQWFMPKNEALVREALRKAGRRDLIGHGPDCLVAPEKGEDGARKAPSAKPAKGKPQKNNTRPDRRPKPSRNMTDRGRRR